MTIYVGNLSYDTTEESLKKSFEPFGPVDRVNIVMDKFSGKSKGFAFVTMSDPNAANKAIAELNGKETDGRRLAVNAARPGQPRRCEVVGIRPTGQRHSASLEEGGSLCPLGALGFRRSWRFLPPSF